MTWLESLAEIRKTDWSKVPEPERTAAAREVMTVASYAAAASAVVPIPLVDAALLIPIHTTMVMTIGHVHGRNLSDAEAKRVALELGAVAGVTMAGRVALSALKKFFLPGIGGVLAAPASFAVTWALGQVAQAYFTDPSISREDLKTVFSEAFKEGKSSYSTDEQAKRDRTEDGDEGGGQDAERPEPVIEASEDPSPDEEADSSARAGFRPKKRSL